MDAGELLPKPLGDCRQHRVERWIAGDAMRGGGPRCPPHDEERLAENRRVGVGEKRLGHRNPGLERGLQHGEFLQAVEAGRNPGRGCRA